MMFQLILADSSAGKTEYVQSSLLELKQRDPLAKIWILMATERQINAFRTRLVENSPERPLFNLEFFDFYNLYRHLLAAAGKPQRTLDDMSQQLLMRSVVMSRPNSLFAPIAGTSGLARVLSDLIFELKENLITPELFSAAAADSKTTDLAEIYRAYQAALQQYALSDREGEGWLALEALQAQPQIVQDVQMLIVDGYDQFPRSQAELLAALSRLIPNTYLTLTFPEQRPLLGKRFAQARERLQEAAGELLTTITLPQIPDMRPPQLRHLSNNLMKPSASRFGVEEGTQALTLIEAPEASGEVNAILRQIKRLLLDGEAPDALLIALRDWETYAPLLRMGFKRLKMPVMFHRAQPLIQNPAVAAVFALLDLPFSDFRRRDLLDVLRSPYFQIPGIGQSEAALLERLSFKHVITGGRLRWLAAVDAEINRTGADTLDEEGEARPEPDIERLRSLRVYLEAFFEQITPPPEGDAENYILWLENLLGEDTLAQPEAAAEEETAPPYHLNLPARIRSAHEQELIGRDIAAIDRFKMALRSLLSAELLAIAFGAPLHNFASFLASIRAAVESDYVEGHQREGHVLVTVVNDARGIAHRHLFIPGLSEGIFPAPAPENPLLLDEERLQLRKNGVLLSTQAERTDDFGIFYELINQAKAGITLTRPTVKNGAPWIESPLWRSVTVLFDDLPIIRLKPGDLPPPNLAPTLADATIVLAATYEKDHAPYIEWLTQSHPAMLRRLQRNREGEQDRLKRRHSIFNGYLGEGGLLQNIAGILGESYVWSASQLDLIGSCGFRFFAGRVLKLEPIIEPQIGPNALIRGSISHKILEQVYRYFSENGIQPHPDHEDSALEVLEQIAAQVLDSAPATFGFAPHPLWPQESAALRQRLQKVLRADFEGAMKLDKQFQSGRHFSEQELRFGESTSLTIALDDQTFIRMRGTIDRIDLAEDGSRMLIIDYKSGSESSLPTLKQYTQGRSFQILTYLLAASELLDAREIGGAFVSLRDAKSGDVLWLDDVPAGANGKALDSTTGKATLARYIQQVRAGDFSAEANGMEENKCHQYCDYAQLCRIHVMERRQRGSRRAGNESVH
ncbi:MAG: exodeoxyribonuclease V subunit gamma [Anaerolineae bacterium]|nr:exodeoxyribonuclease V subunit gamma [Anaerolineae bacterium]